MGNPGMTRGAVPVFRIARLVPKEKIGAQSASLPQLSSQMSGTRAIRSMMAVW